ncbi:MAG: septum formation initiator family protein [Alphaproteobacteria bacterium]|nr:septum formation initiator family protein [Alphaproteobacteria bacterium]
MLRRPIHDWRKLSKQFIVLLTCSGIASYFAYHAINGRHGLEAKHRFLERITLLEFEIKGLEAARARYAQDVALLTPELPNADLVEEIARDVLGFVHPDDAVVMTLTHDDATSTSQPADP